MKTALALLGTSMLMGALSACSAGLSAPEAAGASHSPEPSAEAASGDSAAMDEARPAEEPMSEAAPAPPPAPEPEALEQAERAAMDDVAPAASRGAALHKPASTTGKRSPAQLAGGVRAGEWDDNANYREFSKYLAQKQQTLDLDPLAISGRRFLVVRDRDGKAVPNCSIHVKDGRGRQARLTTTASGRALLFPRAEGLRGQQVSVSAQCLGASVTQNAQLSRPDGVIDLKLPTARTLPNVRTVDVVFILDTTGSMSEEIGALKGTIAEVAEALGKQNARPRLGLVEYRDVTDGYVTRLHQMTTDVDGFAERVGSLSANGGGDTPEHVNAGLRVAVQDIHWSPSSVARLAFLIGDAPPQLHYEQDVSYTKSAQAAGHQGIQIFTIAASGMDGLGQAVWRQIAQYTGGTNMFVLRGGAGPQSTGAGDAESSCGGTHQNYSSGNLAELITGKVKGQLKALDADPLRIAGLGQDEKAKPCKDRITLAR